MAKDLFLIPLGGNGGGGERGYQGVQGAVGATGSQGIQGADGVGYQGVQGTAGLNGTDGFQGTAGLNGINGEQGVQGATGASIQGLQGEKGESIQGATGAQGTTGFQGIMGLQGAAGSGGGVETVELTELTSEELGNLYEIVVNSNPIDITDYLAEHRLTAYGMPVISWGNATYSISTYSELVEDEEGNAGAAFYTDTRIEKVVETPDLITTYWYCIFEQKDGDNITYVLENGSNWYENSGGTPIQGIQGATGQTGAQGTTGFQGIMGLQGASGGGASKTELMTLPLQDLVQIYQDTLAGTMKDFSQYTANGYPIINAYKMNAGWVVDTSYLTDVEGTTYTTDGTEVAIVMNQKVGAVGAQWNETQRNFYTYITLFSPTIYQTYGQTIDTYIRIGYDQVAQLQFVLADDSIVNYTMPLTQW